MQTKFGKQLFGFCKAFVLCNRKGAADGMANEGDCKDCYMHAIFYRTLVS